MRLAIFFHLGNQAFWNEFNFLIKNVYDFISLDNKDHVDLYISHQNETELIRDIPNIYPDVILSKTTRGCDIGGNLMNMWKAYQSNFEYDYALVLHTKTNNEYRKWLTLPLCGSSEIVKKNLDIFNGNQSIGMIGSNKMITNLSRHNYNHSILSQMCQKWNLDYSERSANIQFIGGTMFWVRWKIYVQFFTERSINLEVEYYNLEPAYCTNRKPTVMHSWERVYGLIIQSYGLKIHAQQVPTNINNNNNNNINSKSSNNSSKSNKKLPLDWNWQHYLCCNSDIAKLGFSEKKAIEHYIKCGRNEDRKYKLSDIGISKFDYEFYLSYHKDLIPKGVNDYNSAIKHFALYGRSEGRICCKPDSSDF